jgi:hypothetical protein
MDPFTLQSTLDTQLLNDSISTAAAATGAVQ